MQCVVETTNIEGLKIIIPKTFLDDRGSLTECFNYDELGIQFVQDNLFVSKKNVLRGLHVQKEPQAKIIKVIDGIIYDVVVDMRKDSKTFLKWFGVELSEDNSKELYIPEGFAHGFISLTDNSKVWVKLSSSWNQNNEIGIPWNDTLLNIEWPGVPIIADKDKKYISLKEQLSEGFIYM